MEVCALVSGGKDSLFNIKVCEELGHKVSVLANLHPSNPKEEELDSFVYQTVGHNLLPLLATATARPLVRRAITGSPVLTERNAYVQTPSDETEDLFFLLQQVKDMYPQISAISVGAIFSDYQRLRVEHVASRLGLKVLAFLWRQPQSRILCRMAAAKLHAVLVKVASFGLSESHVGQDLVSLAPLFDRLNKDFGFHVAGEGGEYESFVLKFPGVVKYPVRLEKVEIVKHAPDVWYLRGSGSVSDAEDVEEAVTAYPDLTDGTYYEKDFKREAPIGWELTPVDRGDEGQVLEKLRVRWVESADFEVGEMFAEIPDIEQTIFVELQISDMSRFSEINEKYGSFFRTLDEPPARCTIQSALPEGVQVRARVVLAETKFARLHVQSISTWAMACIGPYAQAVSRRGVCLTSGVLGLVPHSMTLAGTWRDEIFHAMRSLHNVVSVALKEIHEEFVPFALVQISANAPSVSEVEEVVNKYLPNFQILTVRVSRLPREATVEINFILGLNVVLSSGEGSDEYFQVFYDVNKVNNQQPILCPDAGICSTPCLEIGGFTGGVACIHIL